VTSDRVDIDPRLIKAIAHPLRHRILLALGEEVSSPKQIAARLGEPLGRVGHHVRVLAGLGAIELVDTRARRGAIEHFYRAAVRPLFYDDAWARLPRWTRRAVFAQYLGRILEDVRAAAAGDGFDDPRAAVAYMLLDLDREGHDEMADILTDSLQRILAAKERSEERLSQASGEPLRTEVALLYFKRR
jgi:DNA-binding transcriptional ArsR family regulator